MNGLVGVLLAAGRSRRMGAPKQLLPWNSGTVVSSAFDAIAPHCERMIVVLGHEAAKISHALAPRPFVPVHTDPDAEMIVSIKAGLAAAAGLSGGDAVLLHPADLPGVAPSTVRLIVDVHRRHPQQAIMPESDGRGGHPVLIPRAMFAEILGQDVPGGLRMFWQGHADRCRRVTVDDPGCVHDLDTPADYEKGRGAGPKITMDDKPPP